MIHRPASVDLTGNVNKTKEAIRTLLMLWDALNRATSIVGEAYGARYVYRADGMRVEKVEGLTISWVPPGEEEVSGHYDENLAENLPTSRYYYDGQMMVEDDYTVEGQYEPTVTVMRYGIGARGIDFLAKYVDGDLVTEGFPLYDGHGNMIATLSRTGTAPYFSIGDLRSYDVWGSVRSGSSTGDPKQRYCANLGHVQDEESGLIYMRARYYEPWSGRFISEDPARDGANWFVYCGGDPVNRVDENGREWIQLLSKAAAFFSRVLWVAIAVANLLNLNKELRSLLNALAGMNAAIDATIRLIAIAGRADAQRGSPMAVGQIQAMLALKTFALFYMGWNIKWWIALQDDPDIDVSEAFSQ